MSLSEQEALQTMALLIQGQINADNFWLVKAPWRSGLWKCDLWSSILAMVPKTYEEALLHQVLDECRHNLRCPASGRFMRNRLVFSGSFALSNNILKICEGHGGRDHQQIKGSLEPGITRSEYARANN